MEIREMMYEGKAKKVFKTDNEDHYLVQYKDDATAFNGVKKERLLVRCCQQPYECYSNGDARKGRDTYSCC